VISSFNYLFSFIKTSNYYFILSEPFPNWSKKI
jgi:hypothetical protein